MNRIPLWMIQALFTVALTSLLYFGMDAIRSMLVGHWREVASGLVASSHGLIAAGVTVIITSALLYSNRKKKHSEETIMVIDTSYPKERMCNKCKSPLLSLGKTTLGKDLYSCPKCEQVYFKLSSLDAHAIAIQSE